MKLPGPSFRTVLLRHGLVYWGGHAGPTPTTPGCTRNTLTTLAATRPRSIDEHRYRSVRFFQDPVTKARTRYEPWTTTIVDLDSGQVLDIVDGRDHKGVGDWLFARSQVCRLGVQVVAINPFGAFRKALGMWLPRTAVSVDLFPVTMLANDMFTTVRQGLSQQVRGRRGRATDPAWANRLLLLKANENLPERGHHRLAGVFAVDDPAGSLEAAWQVKEKLRTLLNTSSTRFIAADHSLGTLKSPVNPVGARLNLYSRNLGDSGFTYIVIGTGH